MAATAVQPFRPPPTPEGGPSGNQFVRMQDQGPSPQQVYDMDEEEARLMEKRGRRLRRASLTLGIVLLIAIVCTAYSFFAIRWTLINYFQPEQTHYQIEERMATFRFGVFFESILIIAETFIGILIGIILIGAGVNPAMSVMVVVFKIIQQAILGANAITLVAALILYDPRNRFASVIQDYFYSDYQVQIGPTLAYLFLLINRYGHIFSEMFAGIQMGLFGFTIVMWGVFPRFLGYTILASGPCYVLSSFLYLYWPKYDGDLTVILMIPVVISQLGLAGWALVSTPHPAKNREFIPGLTTSRSQEQPPKPVGV